MKDLQLIVTSDGSHSLLNTALHETYHSVHGAIQESRHVFIAEGLKFLHASQMPSSIQMLEVGFGTGLNAILTIEYALASTLNIHYTSLESHPVDWEMVQQLNYPSLLACEGAARYFESLHRSPWNKQAEIATGFYLEKKATSIQQANLATAVFDLVFFDAFAPSKQPEMWEMPILQKVMEAMKPGAVLVTYCAKGQLKRDLKSLGLVVETLAGPPGKKEMVRATKK